MSDTDIANLALGRLGVGQAIASLSETSTPARLCNRFYVQCRQEVLRAHPWGFASRSVSIAQVAGQTFPGWTYVYQYPNNGLMVWAVADVAGIRQVSSWLVSRDPYCWQLYDQLRRRYPFKIALKDDLASSVILSDMPNAYAYYTHDVTVTGVYPADFTSLFAWKLASEVGGPLEAKADLVAAARQQYWLEMQTAAAGNMNEQRDDMQPDSPSISARY
mgnify:CR=1 FL=1